MNVLRGIKNLIKPEPTIFVFDSKKQDPAKIIGLKTEVITGRTPIADVRATGKVIAYAYDSIEDVCWVQMRFGKHNTGWFTEFDFPALMTAS